MSAKEIIYDANARERILTGVNTLVRKAKLKRFRGTVGRQSDFKKAIVTLADGHSIDVATGL